MSLACHRNEQSYNTYPRSIEISNSWWWVGLHVVIRPLFLTLQIVSTIFDSQSLLPTRFVQFPTCHGLLLATSRPLSRHPLSHRSTLLHFRHLLCHSPRPWNERIQTRCPSPCKASVSHRRYRPLRGVVDIRRRITSRQIIPET